MKKKLTKNNDSPCFKVCCCLSSSLILSRDLPTCPFHVRAIIPPQKTTSSDTKTQRMNRTNPWHPSCTPAIWSASIFSNAGASFFGFWLQEDDLQSFFLFFLIVCHNRPLHFFSLLTCTRDVSRPGLKKKWIHRCKICVSLFFSPQFSIDPETEIDYFRCNEAPLLWGHCGSVIHLSQSPQLEHAGLLIFYSLFITETKCNSSLNFGVSWS